MKAIKQWVDHKNKTFRLDFDGVFKTFYDVREEFHYWKNRGYRYIVK